MGGVSCLILYGFPAHSHAKEVPQEIDRGALQILAKDFVSKVGEKLKAHDQKIAAEKIAGDDPLSLVPDGELLLLRPRADKFVMDREIAAIKDQGTIYYALSELIEQLEFPIDYSDERKTGAGWYLREDWLIRFDFNKAEVVSRGETYNVDARDIYEDNGQIFISQKAAQKWMSIETEPDIAQQYLNIRTPYPFPALARNYRLKNVPGGKGRNEAELPRHETEREMFRLNTAEIQQSMRYRKRENDKATTNHQNITTLQGDALKHGFYGMGIWDNKDNITGIRARLTKESEEPTLLGPLKAREYVIGDTELAHLPLTGITGQELGIRINNNPLRNADFQDTTISGDSLPGWDVELYRDGFLIDRIRVGDDARYDFQDIELFAGDNMFEVFFYGPQGEVRRDAFNIPVNEEFLTTQNNTYDVSLTFNQAQTYNKFKSESEDADTPHLVARYNKLIGNTLTHVGVRTQQIDGDQKAFLGTGFTNVLHGFVLDGNAAVDEQGAPAGELGIRKNIADWRLSLRANARADDFKTDNNDSNVLGITASANKNFRTAFDTYASFNTTAGYGVREDDSTQTFASAGLSHQAGRLNISNTLTYDKIGNVPGAGDLDASINNFLSARMNFGRVFTRAGVNYRISPDSQVENYFGQISYQPSNKLSGDVQVEHTPENHYTEGRLSVNYRHDKFRVTPFVEYDSNKTVEAGIRLTTALINEPQNTMPSFTSDRMTGRGLVSSFVFHDKNGNGIFDGEDIPLPGVTVQSVNVARRAPTDDKGYSLIKDLPENYLTDIRIDTATLPDPFMIPGFEGASIYPRAGQMARLSFPVHMAGEIDGAVEIIEGENRRSASGLTLSLIPIDGKSSKIIDTFTAGDGYYVFSNVPPGDYIMTVSPESAKRARAGGAAPVPVSISYDGTVISGQNMVLQRNRMQVPFQTKPYKGADRDRPFFALETGDSPKKSRLSSLLSKLIEDKADMRADEGLFPLAMDGSESLKYMPNAGWQDHYERCQLLIDEKIPCSMVLFVPETGPRKATQIAQN